MGESIVKLENVTRRFGNIVAVKKASFDVKRGEICALIGPNGAGKTTSIKMLIGTLYPTAGKVTINGWDCFKERHKCLAITGYVPDEPTFPAYIRANELINFYGEMHGMEKAYVKERMNTLSSLLDLKKHLGGFAVNFSKGMKKKLALILALLHEPDVLILDELTNGLDPSTTRELHDLIRRLSDSGCAILFSTHLLNQAETLCDTVAVIANGEVKVKGALSELKHEGETLEELYFRFTDSDGVVKEEGQVVTNEA